MNEKLSFEEVTGELYKNIDLYESEINDFTDDFSFKAFLGKFINDLVMDIERGIEDKKPEPFDEFVSASKRYFGTIINALEIRNPSAILIDIVKKINLLIDNWLRMIEEFNMVEENKMTKEDVHQTKFYINEVNEIIGIGMTTKRMIYSTKKLIEKAERILAATPPAFNISRHFYDAIHHKEDK